jgi:hypothetical protein
MSAADLAQAFLEHNSLVQSVRVLTRTAQDVNTDHHTYVMVFLPMFRGAAESGSATGEIPPKAEGQPVVCSVQQEGRHLLHHAAQDRTGRTSPDPAQAGNGADEAQDQAQRRVSRRVLEGPVPDRSVVIVPLPRL